jgi:hypothetical protein
LYLNTSQTDDDVLLASLITKASQAIDTHCMRTFVRRTETRLFDAVQDTDGNILYVDDDLIGVISLTNGDGEVLGASTYVLLPANEYPKYAIKLKSGGSKSWTFNTDPEEAISVNGTWGYQNSTTAPADIQHAAARLATWYYHQRQAPFETTGFPDLGQVVVPSALPEDIKGLLAPYMRVEVLG